MANKVVAIIEQRDGKIKRSSFEAVSKAAEIAGKLSADSAVLLIGADTGDIDKIASYGIKKVVHYKHDDLKNYSPSAYSKIAADFIKENGASVVLISNTAFAKDLAPRIAVKTDASLLVDVVELYAEDGIKAVRPVFAGKALQEVTSKAETTVVTLRPNVFRAEANSADSAEVDIKEPSDLDLSTKVVELKKSEGKLDVAEAEVVVSGGRGLKEAENFKLVEELAEQLDAAVGASRAVVDAGWRPHSEQVGQTGKTVSPQLYIAVGISGAIQHLAGMSSSKYIVAVNKDKDAPIFSVADYGIAGDLFEVIPALIEELKKE